MVLSHLQFMYILLFLRVRVHIHRVRATATSEIPNFSMGSLLVQCEPTSKETHPQLFGVIEPPKWCVYNSVMMLNDLRRSQVNFTEYNRIIM